MPPRRIAIASVSLIALGALAMWSLKSEVGEPTDPPIPVDAVSGPTGPSLSSSDCFVPRHGELDRELGVLRDDIARLRRDLVARDAAIAKLEKEKQTLENLLVKSADEAVTRYLALNATIKKEVFDELDRSTSALLGNAEGVYNWHRDTFDDATSARLTLLWFQLRAYDATRRLYPYPGDWEWTKDNEKDLLPGWKQLFESWDQCVSSWQDLKRLACRSVVAIVGEQGLASLCREAIPPQYIAEELRDCPNKVHLWIGTHHLFIWSRYLDRH